ncbi:MAG: hypothetical protein AB7O97_17650 [Planctomycetota bacterium]
MYSILSTTALLLATSVIAPHGGGGGDGRLFLPAARLHGDGTATLPLHQGRVGERTVWFVVLDASTSDAADRFGSNRANKLRNARGTGAVQQGHFDGAVLVLAGTVDFAPERIVVGDPVTGFPPLQVQAGSVGDADYSPLVQLPDGTVLNAPQLLNDSGVHDKVVAFDLARRTVRVRLSDGFSRGAAVVYLSTDASSETAAALEASTLAPRLDLAPFAGGDGTDSARASLAAFVNGPTGADNRQRQGLNSALLGEGDPLNVLAWSPNQGRYSPLWDVHLAAWADGRRPTRQTGFDDVEDLAEDGAIRGPDGGRFGPSDFVVNCPIVAEVRGR